MVKAGKEGGRVCFPGKYTKDHTSATKHEGWSVDAKERLNTLIDLVVKDRAANGPAFDMYYRELCARRDADRGGVKRRALEQGDCGEVKPKRVKMMDGDFLQEIGLARKADGVLGNVDKAAEV